MKTQRRTRGSGSIYQVGRIWWISYRDLAGQRVSESSGSTSRTHADRLLRRRVGAVDHGIATVPNAEKLTFEQSTQALIEALKQKGARTVAETEGRITLHLAPFFRGRRLAGLTSVGPTGLRRSPAGADDHEAWRADAGQARDDQPGVGSAPASHAAG